MNPQKTTLITFSEKKKISEKECILLNGDETIIMSNFFFQNAFKTLLHQTRQNKSQSGKKLILYNIRPPRYKCCEFIPRLGLTKYFKNGRNGCPPLAQGCSVSFTTDWFFQVNGPVLWVTCPEKRCDITENLKAA